METNRKKRKILQAGHVLHLNQGMLGRRMRKASHATGAQTDQGISSLNATERESGISTSHSVRMKVRARGKTLDNSYITTNHEDIKNGGCSDTITAEEVGLTLPPVSP